MGWIEAVCYIGALLKRFINNCDCNRHHNFILWLGCETVTNRKLKRHTECEISEYTPNITMCFTACN